MSEVMMEKLSRAAKGCRIVGDSTTNELERGFYISLWNQLRLFVYGLSHGDSTARLMCSKVSRNNTVIHG